MVCGDFILTEFANYVFLISRNLLYFEEWLELDLKYIRERSFMTDWKIVFKTIGAVLGMNGE